MGYEVTLILFRIAQQEAGLFLHTSYCSFIPGNAVLIF